MKKLQIKKISLSLLNGKQKNDNKIQDKSDFPFKFIQFYFIFIKSV
jgi:hypothetical protein